MVRTDEGFEAVFLAIRDPVRQQPVVIERVEAAVVGVADVVHGGAEQLLTDEVELGVAFVIATA
jgi:hypothetical protein